MSKFLLGIFEDNSGGTSAIRVLLFLWFLPLIVLLSVDSYKAGHLSDIPPGVKEMSMVLVGLKALQRWGEKPEVGI